MEWPSKVLYDSSIVSVQNFLLPGDHVQHMSGIPSGVVARVVLQRPTPLASARPEHSCIAVRMRIALSAAFLGTVNSQTYMPANTEELWIRNGGVKLSKR